MPASPAFERVLKRDRVITLAGLIALCALAWLYMATGAGLGMSGWEMTRLALFPHQHASASGINMAAAASGSSEWSLAAWALMISMWWIMMIAMMTPSAAPTILLYSRVHTHAARDQTSSTRAPIAAFAAGYLLVWLAFAIVAAALHWGLEQAGFISAMMMDSRSLWLSSAVLIFAGVYQLSPLKNVCLSHCRAPAAFLARHWHPGAIGAVRLGMLHGGYCVGCCWHLMALLFVGGVMNLVWIAVLAVLILLEQILRAGVWIGRAVGVALIAWGIATLFA